MPQDFFNKLACPKTQKPLKLVDLSESEIQQLKKIKRKNPDGFQYEIQPGSKFLTSDGKTYYSIIDGFPILMYPEKLVPLENEEVTDVTDLQYREAYEEMTHYNSLGASSVENLDEKALYLLMGNIKSGPEEPAKFPFPAKYWVDAKHDSLSQLEAYEYLAPLTNKTFLQLGGSGSHAVKAILAGAESAVHLTPMIGEAIAGRKLAEHYGVEDRFEAVIAIGEELPFRDDSFDTIYSGGCVHHMRTEFAFAEFHRVLTVGGRFSAVDPWKTPIHGIGTRLFGKRECDVFCRPIDPIRLKPISIFTENVVKRHGAFFRYPFLVLDKFGLQLPIGTMMNIGRVDDFFGKLTGTVNTFGGSILLAGEKTETA